MAGEHTAQPSDMDSTVRFAGDLVDRAAAQSGYILMPERRTVLIMDFIATWFGTANQKQQGPGPQQIKIDWNA